MLSVRKTQGAASDLFPKRYRDRFRKVLEPFGGKKQITCTKVVTWIPDFLAKMVSINSSYCCYTHSLFRSFSVDFTAVSRQGTADIQPIVSAAAIAGT